MDYPKFLSKFAYIFLIFVIVASGYLKTILSCQMQYYLENISYYKHILGVIMVFVFIMSEGGWSFNQEENDMADNNWSSGNAFHSLIFAFLLYILLLLTAKSRIIFNIIFFIVIFILYIINTQRSYYYVRKFITDERNSFILKVELYIFIIAICILVYGLIDYILYQKNNYKSQFSWYIFLSGINNCTKLQTK